MMLRGLVDVVDAGELDRDLVGALLGDDRLGDAELVDAVPHDRHRAVEVGRRQLDAFRRLRLQHVLEAALKIEALFHRPMRGRARDGEERHAAEGENDQHHQDEMGTPRRHAPDRLARFRGRLRVGFRLDLHLDLAGHGRNGATVEGDDHPGRDFEPHLVVVDLPDDSVQPARGDDLVVELDRILHRGMRALAAPRGNDEEHPDGGEHEDQDQECAHVSLSSQSRLYEANTPPSIASRAPRVSSSTKRRLWSESSRSPSSSFWLTRWRM